MNVLYHLPSHVVVPDAPATSLPTDYHSPSEAISIETVDGGRSYKITHRDAPSAGCRIVFESHGPFVLTEEALLAIVLHRLELRRQALPEGSFEGLWRYMAAGDVRQALHCLKAIDAYCKPEPVEKPMDKPASDPAPVSRIAVRGDNLEITTPKSTTVIAVGDLQEWRMWQTVETRIKQFDLPLTPTELEILNHVAKSQAAKNGLAELKSALEQAGKLK